MLRDAPVELAIGDVLEGRFRLDALLGRGGMGSVYAAEELRLRRRCALKVLRQDLTGDRDNVERFLREARTIAGLRNRHIVEIHSFGEDPSGAVFYAMELLVGEDLEARLRDRRQRPVSWRDVCEWGAQIARGMAAVHGAGLIHRDLKPGNVFLAQDDGEVRVKLLDFGIVRPEDGSELTGTGAALGTPHYMSPEQIRAQHMDRRSDIYSFGALLFKGLTGRFVFRGEPIQVAMMHVEATPAPPSSLVEWMDVPPELDAIVLRCLAKRPADRFQTMEELELALQTLLRRAPGTTIISEMPAGLTTDTTLAAGLPISPADSTRARSPAESSQLRTVADSTSAPIEHPPATLQQRRLSRRPALLAGLAVAVAIAITAVILTRDPTVAPPVVATLHPPIATLAAPEPTPTPIVAAPEPTPAPQPALPAPATTPDPPPVVTPTPTPTPTPAPTPASKRPAAREDPQRQLTRKAAACRREHGDGPPIVIDYAVASDGKVTRAVPKQATPLGQCLADLVKRMQFPAKLALGQKLSL